MIGNNIKSSILHFSIKVVLLSSALGLLGILVFVYGFDFQINGASFPFLGGGVNLSPKSTINDSFVDREQRSDGLRKLGAWETGKSVYELPQGVYGFASATELALGGNEAKLTSIKKARDYFEIQKPSQDTLLIVGFIDAVTLSRVGNGERGPFELTLFPNKGVVGGVVTDFPIGILYGGIQKISERKMDAENGEVWVLDITTTVVVQSVSLHE